MQAKNNLSSVVDLRGYYESLTKKEKTQFLGYMYKEYDINQYTLMRKLKGNYNGPFRQTEINAVEEAINSGTWRE